jgi:hypothetical protein
VAWFHFGCCERSALARDHLLVRKCTHLDEVVAEESRTRDENVLAPVDGQIASEELNRHVGWYGGVVDSVSCQ